MKLHIVALVLAMLSFGALADDQGAQSRFYGAGGGGTRGGNFSIGGGTTVDALELSYIDLGAVSANATARFLGFSLVQNATPNKGFNFLFRIGIGRETTTFSNAANVRRLWFGNGIFFGIGEQYQISTHLALRAEVNRISYASTPDGQGTGVRYPATVSAMYIF